SRRSNFACRASSDGISLRHGRHHVAHKFTTRNRPLKSPSATSRPSMSAKEIGGAGCGEVAGINSPIFILSDSAATTAAEPSIEAISAPAATHRRRPPMTRLKPRPAGDGPAVPPPNRMWGGRFAGGPAAVMRRINASIDIDRRLYAEDIAGSLAHCAMLVAQRILSPEDGAAIIEGLGQIRAEIEAGTFRFSEA